MRNTELTEKAKRLINWSELSEHLAHNKDSIRSNRTPDKYKNEIDELLKYIEAWLNCKELTTKEDIISEVEHKVKEHIQTVVTEIQNIGKNPFIKH
jgi:hypothetical protein